MAHLRVVLSIDVDPVLYAQDMNGITSVAEAEADAAKYVPKQVDAVVREWERMHAPMGVTFLGYTLEEP